MYDVCIGMFELFNGVVECDGDCVVEVCVYKVLCDVKM